MFFLPTRSRLLLFNNYYFHNYNNYDDDDNNNIYKINKYIYNRNENNVNNISCTTFLKIEIICNDFTKRKIYQYSRPIKLRGLSCGWLPRYQYTCVWQWSFLQIRLIWVDQGFSMHVYDSVAYCRLDCFELKENVAYVLWFTVIFKEASSAVSCEICPPGTKNADTGRSDCDPCGILSVYIEFTYLNISYRYCYYFLFNFVWIR